MLSSAFNRLISLLKSLGLIQITFSIVVLAIVIYFVSHSNFLINRDSYQFLLAATGKNGSTLGPRGESFELAFYNRSLYAFLLGLVREGIQFFTPLNLRQLITLSKAINVISLLAIAVGIYSIARKQIKVNKRSSHLKTIVLLICFSFLLIPTNLFLASAVVNDFLATSFVIWGVYFSTSAEANGNKPQYSIAAVLFALAVGMRIEYSLILAILYLCFPGRKQLFRISLAVMAGVILQIVPQAEMILSLDTDWITNQLSIIYDLRFDIAVISLFILLLSLITFNAKKYLLQILTGLAIAFGCVLILTSPLSLYYLLIIFLSLLPLAITVAAKGARLAPTSDKISQFLLLSILTLFLFYKSFNYQHLVIIFAFIFLLVTLNLKVNLSKQKRNFPRYTIWTIIFLSLFVLPVAVYIWQFEKANMDLAQYTALQVDKVSTEDKKEALVISPFPEAINYLTGLATTDTKLHTNGAAKVLLVEFANDPPIVCAESTLGASIPVSRAYTYINTFEYPVNLKYNSYEEGVGRMPEQVYVHVYVLPTAANSLPSQLCYP